MAISSGLPGIWIWKELTFIQWQLKCVWMHWMNPLTNKIQQVQSIVPAVVHGILQLTVNLMIFSSSCWFWLWHFSFPFHSSFSFFCFSVNYHLIALVVVICLYLKKKIFGSIRLEIQPVGSNQALPRMVYFFPI